MKIRTFSVSEVNRYLKRLLQSDPLLSHVSVKGEISNYKANSAGYAFFTLKDPESRISCVIFFNRIKRLSFSPENGTAVTVKGSVSLYEKSGVYQIYVDEMEPSGTGDLYRKFETLKKKLAEKGYFDEKKKKSIPFYPKKVAIVTSASGAALRDILNVAKRRNKNTDLYIYPSPVQGLYAAENLSSNIELINSSPLNFDLIILSRGGGSIEELWAFNEEILADAIHRSNIPVISAVGHETDFTISDFTSDFRAPTPSAAAEICLPDTNELTEKIDSLNRQVRKSMENTLEGFRAEINSNSPDKMTRRFSYRLMNEMKDLQYIRASLHSNCERLLAAREDAVDSLAESLGRANPSAILEKGYSIVYNASSKVISTIDDVNLDESLTIVVKNGKIKSRVTDTQRRCDE